MNDQIRQLRNTFGQFATGVTVITAYNETQGHLGMTVNSLSSLSLSPPLLLWSLQKSSECFSIFAESRYFAVNILSENQQPLSNRMAAQGRHQLDEEFVWSTGEYGCALFDNCLAHFECALETTHDGGDHTILVGKILSYNNHGGEPLLFHAGKYCRLAAVEP